MPDKLWYKKNKKRAKAYYEKWYAANRHARNVKRRSSVHEKESRRTRILMNKYGISINQYNQMFTDQHGNCAICGINQSKLERRLCVDHCHNSKKIRRLLCFSCNLMLGFAKDDVEVLTKGVKYLNEFK